MKGAHIEWVATCERQHAERQHAARTMRPSTCKRAPRQSLLVRIVRAIFA